MFGEETDRIINELIDGLAQARGTPPPPPDKNGWIKCICHMTVRKRVCPWCGREPLIKIVSQEKQP